MSVVLAEPPAHDRRRLTLRLVVVLCALAVMLCLGCNKLGSPAYYRATRSYQLPSAVAPPPPVPAAARAAITSATSVRFFAPVGCIASAQDSRSRIHSLRCGELMAEFEAAVASRGAHIISWRETTTTSDQSSIELHVKEATGKLVPGEKLRAAQTRWRVNEILPNGRTGTLRLDAPDMVERRCSQRFEALLSKSVPSTKLVVEVTGRGGAPVLWRWHRDFTRAASGDGRFVAEHAVRVRPRVAWPKVIGESLLVVGLVFIAVPLFTNDGTAHAGSLMSEFGMIGAGMSSAGLMAGLLAPRSMLSYPAPGPLLCQDRPAHWLQAQRNAPVTAAVARRFATATVARLWGERR